MLSEGCYRFNLATVAAASAEHRGRDSLLAERFKEEVNHESGVYTNTRVRPAADELVSTEEESTQ
jgi:hypothetical protein